jgi:hypothetical protein
MSDKPKLENAHVHAYFLADLLKAYGPPQKDGVDGVMEIYARLLRQYVPTELKVGAELILQRHTGPHRWPRIPECIKAIEDAKQQLLTRKLVEERKAKPGPAKRPVTDEDRQFVVDVAEGRIDCGLLGRALREMAQTMRNRGGY